MLGPMVTTGVENRILINKIKFDNASFKTMCVYIYIYIYTKHSILSLLKNSPNKRPSFLWISSSMHSFVNVLILKFQSSIRSNNHTSNPTANHNQPDWMVSNVCHINKDVDSGTLIIDMVRLEH